MFVQADRLSANARIIQRVEILPDITLLLSAADHFQERRAPLI
jgi:uncharacterized protein YlzI (FlbEa/FlbD family)